jgi:ligand-binding SRPBCC domain-containing protein
MRLFTLSTVQRLGVGLDEAWSFFSDPANLQEITPPSLDFQIVSELPDRMYAGLIVVYRVTALPRVPMSWVTEITHVDAPHMFVDEQRFGPYRFWHHQHHFAEIPGGVEVRDIVHYAPPRPLAPLVERFLVGPRLRGIFGHRRKVLAERFGEIP